MTELLWKYMEERLQQRGYLPAILRHGPVITISREAGCGGNALAFELFRLIRLRCSPAEKGNWRLINKEVVQLAARKLEIPPEKIEYVFKAQERKLFDEMLAAMSSRYYKSDAQIRKTVVRVIQTFIEDGYVIIVGRGGVAFTRGKQNAINIFLKAPLEHRIKVICEREALSPGKALEVIQERDKERRLLVEHFYGKKTDHTLYDIIINTASWDKDQIVNTILFLMEQKKMI